MIETIGLGRLINPLHFEFMSEFDAALIAAGITPDKLDVEVAYKPFKSALTVLDQSMKNVQASVLTKTIVTGDGWRDDLYVGTQYAVWAALYHYDAATRAAAERIDLVLKQYGNPTKLSYKTETGVLRSLVADFENKLAADMTKIGASHWVAPLKQANMDVEKLIGNRTDEELAQSGINMKDARAAIDPLYKAIATRIDALAVVKGGALFTSFINKHNARVDYFKSTIAQSGARAKAEKKSENE